MQINIVRLLLLTILYLFVPHLIFILGWVQLGIAIPATATLLFLGYKVVKSTQNDNAISETITLSKSQALYLFAFSLLLVAFAGIGELVWQRDDFFKHNLIFSDLLRSNWPVIYPETQEPAMLTYYLGWYMVPAALGKLGGVWVTAFTSFLWTASGIVLLFLWLKAVLKTNSFILWGVFLGISGFEFLWVAGHYVYYLFTYYPQYGLLALLKGTFTYTRSELITPYFNQNIPSFFVGFLSAPQHVVPGFLASAAMVYIIVNKLSFKYSAAITSLMLFWSPLVTIGLIPFAVYHLYIDRRQLFQNNRWVYYLFSAIILFFSISYLLAHRPLPAHHSVFVWQIGGKSWIVYTIAFIALKFGLIYLYLFFKNKKLDFIGLYKPIALVSLCVLVALSFYKLGAYNDLIARASIPAYFIMLVLVVFFLQRIAHEKIMKHALVWLVVGGMLLPRLWQVYKTVAYTPQMETKKYKVADVPEGYTILDHNKWLLQVKPEYVKDYKIDEHISQQYLGSTQSFFYRYLAKK